MLQPKSWIIFRSNCFKNRGSCTEQKHLFAFNCWFLRTQVLCNVLHYKKFPRIHINRAPNFSANYNFHSLRYLRSETCLFPFNQWLLTILFNNSNNIEHLQMGQGEFFKLNNKLKQLSFQKRKQNITKSGRVCLWWRIVQLAQVPVDAPVSHVVVHVHLKFKVESWAILSKTYRTWSFGHLPSLHW